MDEAHVERRLTAILVADIAGNSRLMALERLPPSCTQCGGMLKIDTVSFGEPIPPDVLEVCFRETKRCDCMLVAGTSATVYPAAWFPVQVREKGGHLIEVNLFESELTPLCTVSLRGKSGEILPQLVQAVQELRARS